jgi:endonuclease YncB( thermonuclease family)
MTSRLFITLALLGLAAWVLWSANEGGRELALDPHEPPVAAAEGETLSGVVSHVHDGDTVTLRIDSGEVKVRLGQIDAPELYQPWGSEAMHALESAVEGKPGRIEVLDIDPYDRRVARLFVDGDHVNETLVRQGHAWAYRRWVRDEEILAAEEAARREGRGLWSLPKDQRQPPWDWRRENSRR